MEYSLKQYQITKTKKYLKNNSFFFILNFSKLKSKEWLNVEQNIKKLNLTQYKILNGITTKVFEKSKYKNYSNIIIGLIVFLKTDFIETKLKVDELIKKIKSLFILIAVKLNNKIYLTEQVTQIKTLSYIQITFNLYKTLNRNTKILYKFEKQFEIM